MGVVAWFSVYRACIDTFDEASLCMLSVESGLNVTVSRLLYCFPYHVPSRETFFEQAVASSMRAATQAKVVNRFMTLIVLI